MNPTAEDLAPLPDRSALVFAVGEYRERLARLSSLLTKIGVEVYVGSTPENLNYLAGFDPLGLYFYQHLFYRAGDPEPSLLTHKCEQELVRTQCWIRDVRGWQHGDDPLQMTLERLRQLGVRPGSRVGLEMGNWYLKAGTYQALVSALPDVEFTDVTDAVQTLRTLKSPAEIAHRREAARFSDLGFAGSEYPTLPFIIGSGPRSGLFHAVHTARKVEAGDPVMIELTGSCKRYNANIVRTVTVGKASAKLKTLWDIVTEAFWRPFELIRPALPVSALDRLSREIRKDYAAYIPARAGFGMGLAYPPVWAGRPDVRVGNDEPLAAGMIFSLEPSIGQYHGCTVIFGYNILVTATGAQILQQTHRSLFEVGA